MIEMDQAKRALHAACPDAASEFIEGPEREWFATVPAERVPDAIQALRQAHPGHLSAITVRRHGDGVELLYHLWLGRGLTLRVTWAPGDPAPPSLTPQIPIANWYEREAHDMFGIVFDGHPALTPLLLSDDWDGPPPMLDGEDVQ